MPGKLQPASADPVVDRIKQALKDHRDPMWDEVSAALLRSSCAFVGGELLSGPPEAPYYGKFLIERHHLEWDKIITKYDRFCVEAPRNHGKSHLFTIAYPIWKIITMPEGSGYIFSQTAQQGMRLLDNLKREIERNPHLEYLVPKDAAKRWSMTQIELNNGHRIVAMGFGNRTRGAHPDWIMCDDVVGDDASYSETVRERQKDYFFNAVSNMVNPAGQIGVVGTPQAQNDLYGELEENPSYHFRRFQALSKEGKPLWPRRFNETKLKRIRSEIGTVRFAKEYQCVPVADEMSLFPKNLFYGEGVEQPTVKLGMPLQYWLDAGIRGIYMGVDFALSTNVRADYTVIWVMGVDREGNRWIIDILREKGMPYQQQLSAINTFGQRYQPNLIYLESNQAQRIFSDELQRKTDLPIKRYETGTEKHALDVGLPSLRILLENQKFRIPRGDARSVELTDIWIDEMHNFTFIKGKVTSVGGHDDTVMGCWICDQALRRGGFSFSFGEDIDYSKFANEEQFAASLGGAQAQAALPPADPANAMPPTQPDKVFARGPQVLGPPEILHQPNFGGIVPPAWKVPQ